MPRPRVEAAVRSLWRGGVVSLVAGPGYGKTATVAHILRNAAPHSAYVALDEDDRDPVRFLSFVAEALEGVAPGLGAAALAARDEAPGPAGLAEEMEAAMAQALADHRGPRVAFGLDDVHLVEEAPRIVQSLRWLVAHLPAEWLLLLSSRRPLPFETRDLLGAGRAVELGVRRLRLTPTEVREWARMAWGIQLSLSDSRAVWRISEGWPVALVLMGRHLGNGETPSKERLLGLRRRGPRLGDYLAQDVFASLTPEAATFLMEAFPLERIVFPRDAALFSGGSAAAEDLCRVLTESGFLMMRTGHRTYTLHRLVRGFVEEQTRRRHPEGFSALIMRTVTHLEGAGEVRAAVDVALRGGMPRAAVGSARRILQGSLNASESVGRQDWLERLVDPAVTEEPWLCLLKARLLQDQGGWRAAEELYASARRSFERSGDVRGAFRAALGHGFCLYVLGRWEDALAALRRAEADALGPEERAEVCLNIGAALLALCRWDEAVERFELAMMSAPSEGRRSFEARVAGHRARVFMLRGRYAISLEWARRAVGLASSLTALHSATTMNSAATALYLTGEYDQARVQAEAALALIETRGLAFLRVPCALTHAGIAIGVGDFRSAVSTLKAASAEAVATGDVEAQVWAADLLAQVCRVNRNPARALAHHREALALIEEHGLSVADRVRCLCGRGMDESVLGDAAAARETLDEVVELCRRWGFEAALSPALFYRGWLHGRGGDEEAASRCLREAMRLAAANRYGHLYRVEARVALPVLALCVRFDAGGFPLAEVVPHLPERQRSLFHLLAEGPLYPTDMTLGQVPGSRLALPPARPAANESDGLLLRRFESLTAREAEILRMIAEGLPNKVVAGRLYITEKTIKTHTNNIYRKLGVRNRLQAVLAHQEHERLSGPSRPAPHTRLA